MNVLEKILEEIREVEKEYVTGHKVLYALGATGMATEISNIIRSHMDEIPNCEGCSRRKWYQKGFEDGKKDNDWIPVEEKLPESDGFYLATLDGEICGQEEAFTGLAEFEHGKWIDDEEGYKCVLAWQPLPEPYKEERIDGQFK